MQNKGYLSVDELVKLKDQVLEKNPLHPSEALLEIVSLELENVDKANLETVAQNFEDLKNNALDVVYESDPDLAQDLGHSLNGRELSNVESLVDTTNRSIKTAGRLTLLALKNIF